MHLAELPSDEEVLRAIRVLDDESRYSYGVTAQAIARRLGVESARRLGRGAVAGSWSGSMAAALRIAPRLRSLRRRGLVGSYYDTLPRSLYYLTRAGKQAIRQEGRS